MSMAFLTCDQIAKTTHSLAQQVNKVKNGRKMILCFNWSNDKNGDD